MPRHQGVRAVRPWGRDRADGAWPEPVCALVCLTAWPDGDSEGGLDSRPASLTVQGAARSEIRVAPGWAPGEDPLPGW